MVLDHAYSRKPEKDVDPQNAVTNVEPVSLVVEYNSVLSDESDEEWYDDVDDTGSVCSCDISDEVGAPKNMKILMTNVQISFNTQVSTGLKETRSFVTRASQLFLTAV